MPLLLIRLREHFFISAVVSCIFSSLMQIEVIPQTKAAAAPTMAICLVIIIIYHVKCLSDYLFYVGDLKIYFKTNLTVLLIFFTVNIIMACFNTEPLYTYLFLPYKLGILLGVSKVYSAVSVNAIMFIFTMLIPFVKEQKQY